MVSTALLGGFQALGSGFEVFSVGKKNLFHYVPMKLNKYHDDIMEIAQVCFEKLVVLKLKRQTDCIR